MKMFIVLQVLLFRILACSKKSDQILRTEEIITNSVWKKSDLTTESVFGEGVYLKLLFNKSSNYEIIRYRNNSYLGITQKGKYEISKDVVTLNYTIQNEEISLKYKLLDDKTLAYVKSNGEISNLPEDFYRKE